VQPIVQSEFVGEALHGEECVQGIVFPSGSVGKHLSPECHTQDSSLSGDPLNILGANIDWLVKNGDRI
jgi:hypothetical protein